MYSFPCPASPSPSTCTSTSRCVAVQNLEKEVLAYHAARTASNLFKRNVSSSIILDVPKESTVNVAGNILADTALHDPMVQIKYGICGSILAGIYKTQIKCIQLKALQHVLLVLAVPWGYLCR